MLSECFKDLHWFPNETVFSEFAWFLPTWVSEEP